jgi:spermidine dehydrogenase
VSQDPYPPRSDRELGMDRAISRRDFVQGVAVGGGLVAAGLPAWAHGLVPSIAAQDRPGYYPPRLTGLRGSHPGSFEAAHALVAGHGPPKVRDLDEEYDLIVVGAGISGLSAAHFYLARSPAARVLILDNHDDFGGHAKRNEFEIEGAVRLANGGTWAIESPRPYSTVADGVLKAIGIDAEALARTIQHPEVYAGLGLGAGVFFDRETFGADHLAVGYRQKSAHDFLSGAPLSDAARADIERVEEGGADYFQQLSSTDKKRRLLTLSYRDYLRDVVGIGPEALNFYRAKTHSLWGVGIDAVSALDGWGSGLPGFQGLRLEPGSIPGMGFTPAGAVDTGGSVDLHFPDGNATVARGLVRRLIPEALPGSTVEDLLTARVDYARLDKPAQSVRLRLSSTVLRVEHDGPAASARTVRVTYARDGGHCAVRARHCVLASYNMLIPYLVPELPEPQKAALHALVKTPLVYTTVAVRHWRAWATLGVAHVHAPGSYHTSVGLNPTVDLGSYRSPRSPDEPTLLLMVRTPCQPGLTEHEQHRVGRAELMRTPFEVFERNIRDQLGRMFASAGFDPATDITAITVNRWPHGYAPENNSLFDPDVPESQRPHVLGRVPYGRISIANSDSGGGAYTDVAIDQAHRAVNDLLGA